MSDKTFVQDYIDDLSRLLPILNSERIAEVIVCLRKARERGSTIFVCGNGGSSSIASQMVVDMVKGASQGQKRRFKMIGLTDNIATITAYANDEGYENIFVEPLKNFAQRGDLVIGISGSGNSVNVLRAIEYATKVGCQTIGLTREQGGRLRQLVKYPLLVPSTHMGRLEDCFFLMTHILCYRFMEGSEA